MARASCQVHNLKVRPGSFGLHYYLGIRVFLAAGDHTVGPAVPWRHVRAEVVPLQVIVRAQDGLEGGASVGVHTSPLGSGVLEPNLEIQS